MSYNDEELKQQENGIKIVGYILVPILVISIIGSYLIENSTQKLKDKIENVRNSNFSVIITDKLENRWKSRSRPVLLENNKERHIPWYIYNKINIGDSIVKKKGSDTIKYYTKHNGIIKEDLNYHNRTKYFNKIKRVE